LEQEAPIPPPQADKPVMVERRLYSSQLLLRQLAAAAVVQSKPMDDQVPTVAVADITQRPS
jgi:hypothetical protein